jgi:uncharacterized membrane protein
MVEILSEKWDMTFKMNSKGLAVLSAAVGLASVLNIHLAVIAGMVALLSSIMALRE